MIKETSNLWASKGGDHVNEDCPYRATTEELIELAAFWHLEAEEQVLDATFYGCGLKTRDWVRVRYAYERRNAICDGLLDEACAAEAIAQGEKRLRKRWEFSEDEWHIYRHGPDDERKQMNERFQEQVYSGGPQDVE